MSSTSYAYRPSSSIPITMPKQPICCKYYSHTHQQQYHSPYHRVSVSPSEAPESVSNSDVASYDPSATSSSYAGSAGEYDSASAAAAGVDLLEYMSDRLGGAFHAMPLDRSLAKQAQSSGQLNAKTRELLALQALARSRLAATRANFAEGIKAAKEVQRDLEWTQKRVTAMNQRAAQKYPSQYRAASERYPAPLDY